MRPILKNLLILAGGESSRFYPLSNKNTFNFLGKTQIENTVTSLSSYFENIFIICSSKNYENLNNIFKKNKQIKLIVQKELGLSNAVYAAKDFIQGEVFIINNIDIVNYKYIYEQITQFKKDNKVILFAKKMEEYFPGGYIYFKNKTLKIVEKPDPKNLPSNLVKIVCDYFSDFKDFISVFSKTKNNIEGEYEKYLENYCLRNKTKLIEYNDFWLSLKYPWHTLEVAKFYLSKIKKSFISKKASIAKNVILEGPVYIEDNVKIYEYSKIIGPTFIGKNTIVGNFTLINNCMIGANSLVGGYSEITRSYLGNEVYLHRNYIGDSVLENNILLGAGAITANMRFDKNIIKSVVKEKKLETGCNKLGAIIGSDVKIGINASLLPGVKISSKKIIYPSSLVNKDI